MELSDIQALAENLAKFKDEDFNEETTKHSLVVPFVKMLGYDTCNPLEVRFEYTADFGVKKSDRVDIAILQEGVPILIIECKPLQADLDLDKRSQLSAYFAACPEVRVGLLTNGRNFQFFSDLDEKHIMDSQPFLSFDLLHFDKKALPALQKLCKTSWDLDELMDKAGRLKHLAAIREQIRRDATEPDDEVVKHYANACYEGWKTKAVIDHFRPLVVQAFSDYVSECIAARLKIDQPESDVVPPAPAPEPAPQPEPEPDPSGIITYDSEVHGFVTVKTLLSNTVEPARVQMHDYKGFCSVQLDGSSRKTICRFFSFGPIADDGTIGKGASIEIFTAGKNGESVRHPLETVEDILPFKDELAQAVRHIVEGDAK